MTPNPNDPNKREEEPFPKNSPKESGLFGYAKSNTRDTIAYVFLIVGIIMLFFQPFFGTILIGIIYGLYFSKEITQIIYNANDYIERLGMVKSVVFLVTILALFYLAPGIFLGAALSLCLKYLFESQTS